MKKTSMNNWPRYFLGICAVSGMLLFSACGQGERRDTEENEYGMGADPDAPGTVGKSEGTEYDRTSNTYEAQRNYDVNTMGTAMKNRKELEATGKDLSDQEYEKLRQEYDNVNLQLIERYKDSPGLRMRYTDDYQTADFNYDYYGIYYDNLNDSQNRDQITDLEKRRSALKHEMRGKIDPETNVYIAAEMDAVPKEGYDQLYQHLQQQTGSQQMQNSSPISGTVFVEFVVNKSGNVTNPKAVDVIEAQSGSSTVSAKNPAMSTGTGTSGEGITAEGTTTGMTPNTTGTIGSGNAAGSSGTSTGSTGNSTADQQSQATAPGTATATQDTEEAKTEEQQQLEQKALEAIESTSGMWEPAQMDGQPVASLVRIPVPVNLNTMGSGANTEQGSLQEERQNTQNTNSTTNNVPSTSTDNTTREGGSPESNTGGDK